MSLNEQLMKAPEPELDEPIIAPPLPVLDRIRYGARLWFLKVFVITALQIFRFIKAKEMSKFMPTFTNHYKIRPMLQNRVFIPTTWKSGTKLPLYIDIHGGGFALADPQTDDAFCHYFANTFNFCVVSINYRKAPLHRFPELVHDAAEIARAVLNDPDLPVDHSQVAMGGFSAGGNLSLAIAQLDGIRGKVQALVPIYPVVDFSGKFKGEYKKTKEGRADMLEHSSQLFNWAYISSGADRRDPLMSPIFAPRSSFRDVKMYFIGAQYDYLAHEAEIMALKLAGKDESLVEKEAQWSENGIKWELIPDVQHGFTHVPPKKGQELTRKETCEKLYERIAKWLRTEAF